MRPIILSASINDLFVFNRWVKIFVIQALIIVEFIQQDHTI